jgi:hypothetical protein
MAAKEMLGSVAGFIKKSGKLTALGYATDIAGSIVEYDSQRDSGSGVMYSLGAAAVDLILPNMMGTMPYLAISGVPALAEFGIDTFESLSESKRKQEKYLRQQAAFKNSTFVENPQIYTMRQAGLALAKQSRYKMQETMMGNEARFLHR